MKAFVTGWSAAGHEEYGKRMLDSYQRHCRFPLIVYTEGVRGLGHKWADHRDQMTIDPLRHFLNRWAGDGAVAGRSPVKGWREKDSRAGYSFRFDAYKFCRMVFTMQAAAHSIGDGLMIWLDGDTVIRKPVPHDVFERALPADKDIAYLGRKGTHSETGFVVFRLPEALPVLDAWAAYYADDSFRSMAEWHSAYLFDRAREAHPEVRGHDLTPGGRGHVIHQCWVGGVFDHCKGPLRKKVGVSWELRT